ncbi:hypothetical protein KKC44_05480, partial [Patescibacteria group bacterium]|nr:hypothetical protein [Patescibacteria group bacterium]
TRINKIDLNIRFKDQEKICRRKHLVLLILSFFLIKKERNKEKNQGKRSSLVAHHKLLGLARRDESSPSLTQDSLAICSRN